jgi:hypothetical protein
LEAGTADLAIPLIQVTPRVPRLCEAVSHYSRSAKRIGKYTVELGSYHDLDALFI